VKVLFASNPPMRRQMAKTMIARLAEIRFVKLE
jgi:hypothetical protein